MPYKKITYFAKNKSEPNLNKATLRKFDQMTQFDQTKTIKTFKNKIEYDELTKNPEK